MRTTAKISDRLSDVAQGRPPSRLIEHAVEVGVRALLSPVTRSSPPRASAETRAATLIVVPKIVAAAFDSGAEVGAGSNRRRLMTPHGIPGDPQTEPNRVARVGHSEHERVADGLDVLATNGWELRLNDRREVVDELHCVLVSVGLGERREARDVRKQEGRCRARCHRKNLTVGFQARAFPTLALRFSHGRARAECLGRSRRSGAGTRRGHEELAWPRLGEARRTPA